jgi:CheY-like chemotaxis protein
VNFTVIPERPMTPARIVVVEDERIIAMDLASSLRSLGHAVVAQVVDAAAAIEAVQALRPDLVLVDIHLRGPVDGIEAALLIRERYGVPCIFITAYAEADTQARARMAGPLAYLIKPFDLGELAACIDAALAQHKPA